MLSQVRLKKTNNSSQHRSVVFLIIVLSSAVPCFLTGQGVLAQTDTSIHFITDKRFKSFFAIVRSAIMNLPEERAWKKIVPEIKRVYIKSSFDSTEQPALFHNSGSSRKKPLLLALHSWSENYQSRFSIPYGIWAVKNDWVLIHPDYRGTFNNPSATLSEIAVGDILDAVDYAKKNASIDESRVYVCGFSGGAMATLVMVGRYPEMWSAASAWVPVYDLSQWYQTTRKARHNYSRDISNSCGGSPLPGTEAHRECLKRSVSTYLRNARGQGVPVYIGSGIKDRFVPPGHSIQAFNDLAGKDDRVTEEDITYINNRHALPEHLRSRVTEPLFEDAGFKVLLSRTSSSVTLKIFDGDHDIIFNECLYWLSQHRKPQK
ncbi:MAG: prolyl oligopeptidase family serine peptidase [Chitinispirillaceae bacterium]|nr:prolyl oligopeptidase family serine peptidase [Chitinispirillaceae bacterium]